MRLHRPALLRCGAVCGPVGLLLRVAPTFRRSTVFRIARHAACGKARRDCCEPRVGHRRPGHEGQDLLRDGDAKGSGRKPPRPIARWHRNRRVRAQDDFWMGGHAPSASGRRLGRHRVMAPRHRDAAASPCQRLGRSPVQRPHCVPPAFRAGKAPATGGRCAASWSDGSRSGSLA